MNIFRVIRQGKSLFLLAQLILTSFYRRLGQQFGVEPGAEMMEGARLSEETGAQLVLADRNIEITLKRVWGHLGLWHKFKMITQVGVALLVGEDVEPEMIEQLKEQDQLDTLMATFADAYPEIKRRLIDERDTYLAQKIRSAPGQTVVAVVGAGHVAGIEQHIHHETDLEPLLQMPPRSIFPVLLKWGIPLAIIALLVYGFFKGGAQHSLESVYIWVGVNGVLSALGAALAFGHPLTVVTSFFAAPLTSLNPMVAAGWVAGLVQAWVRTPTVADLERLPEDIGSLKGFWSNPVCRILLVVILANLGSAAGTWLAGFWIAARTL
jgi:pheromone shutdown-related protein TraB